ncbi:MAG: glycosyltransferase family 2 protein [Bacteroidales bacterium]|nr:glycosyltransferase family 2 protein [Bacteroidales bacterium]
MKVSCIVPVYNTSSFLHKAISSILKQTYQDFEIILINDASTDYSKEICLLYSATYPDKIVFIDKKVNEGVDKARFTGIDYVLKNNPGGSITFLDSDDYLSECAFEKLVSEMKSSNADVVEMRFNRIMGPIRKKAKILTPAQRIAQPVLFDDYYISFFGVNRLSVNLCGKLFKTDLFANSDIQPTGFRMGEDLMLMMELFPQIQRYSVIDYFGYNYRWGGLTSGYNPYFWDNLVTQFWLKRQKAIENNYLKAIPTLIIELKNVLLTNISSQIIYQKKSEEEIKKWISSQIGNNPLWDDIREDPIETRDKRYNTPIFSAIARGDVEYIFAVARERVHQTRHRRKLIGLVYSALKLIKVL